MVKTRLHVKLHYFEIILKLFQRFISDVATDNFEIISPTERVMTLFQNHFGDIEPVGKYS